MLEDRLKCGSANRVISLSKIDKTDVERVVIFLGFLHQHSEREELVCASPTLAKTTLVLLQENLSSGFDPVQQNSSKHLAGDA
jgi:hypothetical protein